MFSVYMVWCNLEMYDALDGLLGCRFDRCNQHCGSPLNSINGSLTRLRRIDGCTVKYCTLRASGGVGRPSGEGVTDSLNRVIVADSLADTKLLHRWPALMDSIMWVG